MYVFIHIAYVSEKIAVYKVRQVLFTTTYHQICFFLI